MKTLFEEIRGAAREGHLSCARAFELALDLQVEPLTVGQEATSLCVRITHCQLGLFGHTEAGKGQIVRPASETNEEVGAAITPRLVEGRLPCREAWEVARETGQPRLDVAAAAESLGIHISVCQLGCFR